MQKTPTSLKLVLMAHFGGQNCFFLSGFDQFLTRLMGVKSFLTNSEPFFLRCHFLDKNVHFLDLGQKYTKTPEKLKTDVCVTCWSKLFSLELDPLPACLWQKLISGVSESFFGFFF